MLTGVNSYESTYSSFIVTSLNNVKSSEIKTNPSSDYMGLALILSNAASLKEATQEFIYSFDPRKYYLSIKDMKNPQNSILDVRA